MINESELRGAESTDVCEDCFGTGTKIDPVKGALPCPCRKSDRFRKVIAAALFLAATKSVRLPTSSTLPASQDNALLHAHKFANEYPAVERGLLFMGPAGVGKTHLAVSIIRDLIDKGFATPVL